MGSSGMYTRCRPPLYTASEGRALERVVGGADAEPAVAVGVEQDLVGAARVGAAVLVAQHVDQALAGLQPERLRRGAEVVYRHHGGVAELVAQHQHLLDAARKHPALAPADFGALAP